MTIGAIGGCAPQQAASVQFRSGAGGSTPAAASNDAQGGKGGFIDAIASALTEIGITSGSSKGGDDSDAAAALGDFLKNLMDTLHAEGAGGSRPPPPPPPPLAGAAPASESSDGGSSLESAFTSLLEALGVSTDDATTKLGDFLQALAGKLEQNGSSGNLLDTTA
jgi:hypothetical protein